MPRLAPWSVLQITELYKNVPRSQQSAEVILYQSALARAYGAHGETVRKTEEFPEAFERARLSGKAAIIEIQLDPEAITPAKTLSQFRNG